MVKINELNELHTQRELAGKVFSATELDNETYHRGPGVSSTTLKEFRKSAAHVYSFQNEPQKEKKCFEFGSLVHDAVLLPEIFNDIYQTDEFAIAKCKSDSKKPRATTIYKDAVSNWKLTNPMGQIVSSYDMRLARGIKDAVLNHDTASILLSDGIPEQAIFWTDEETGLLCKCKPDYLGEYLVDLKTTSSIDDEDFAISAYKFGYHISMGFYVMGIEAVLKKEVSPILIAVETESPFGVKVFPFGQDELMHGKMLARHFLNQYKKCLDTNNWPNYTPVARELKFPPWAWKKEERWMKK